jgi:hypothetical protein
MVQILPPRESFGELVGRSLGSGINQGLGLGLQSSMQKQQQRQELLNDLALAREKNKMQMALSNSQSEKESEMQRRQARALGVSEDITDPAILKEIYKQREKKNFLEQLLGNQGQEENESNYSGNEGININDSQLAQLSLQEPNLAKILQEQKKTKRKEFESERGYHTSFSKSAEEQINKLRESIPKKEMALNFARNAVETGNLEFFSPDKLADITGIDAFRTSKGAQLTTAGKENLLSNMSRVSARGQNMWFEQRLNSMFPKIGQSQEANLTVQEMIEGEVALDKAYQSEFDRLAETDEQKYGYVKKDIDRRARDATKPMEKEIFQRTTYRMKELEEQENGLNSLKKQVGKNVSKGTPLTLAMAKLYKDKFGDTALKIAEKNGYYIPTLDEFRAFRIQPQEYRDEIIE